MKSLIVTIHYKKLKGERTWCTIQCGSVISEIKKEMAETLVQGCSPKNVSEKGKHSIITYLVKISI